MASPSSYYRFDALDADALVLASDSQFKVHKSILSAASPVFRDMFTLPQDPTTSSLPTIPVSEPSTTIDALLRFIYPVADPSISSLSELVLILASAIKYDMDHVILTLRRMLVTPRFLESSPTRVFAIAARFDLDEEAKIASRQTLTLNLLDTPLSDDLKHISAYSYHQLLSLHRQRSKAAADLLVLPEDVKCMQCNASSYGAFAPPRWWTEWEKKARVELGMRPTTEVIFQMGFIAKVATTCGCQRCPGSVLDSYRFLEELKKRIDELPSTI